MHFSTARNPQNLTLRGHDSSSSSSDSDDGDKKGDKKSSPLKCKVYGIFGREKPGGKPADVFLWRDKKISAGLLVAQLASGLAQRLDPFSPEADGVSPQGVTSGSNPSFVIGDPMKKVQWVETTRRA
ncbi:hypothetical protein RJ640_010871 [Escallonia rubra]|uniref:Uncharacterized protein n=1 Tax=Escallonia rubra TaxID=112253 RepID=A0AA88RSM6_9ASTE|nr:hypothetical protein RJ640_010871 [Escallonia rubra]